MVRILQWNVGNQMWFLPQGDGREPLEGCFLNHTLLDLRACFLP